MARVALVVVLFAGCAGRREWRPEYEAWPGETPWYAFVELRGGGRVIFEAWRSDASARAVDGVGRWYDSGGRILASGRLHVPLRVVWKIDTVRIRPRRYDPLENALVAAFAIGFAAADVYECSNGVCSCDRFETRQRRPVP